MQHTAHGAVLFLALSILVGCAPAPPQPRSASPTTHQVIGKIVHKNGQAYTKGGLISFKHESKEGFSTDGSIDGNGAFKLQTTSADHANLDGALEGTYTVTVLQPASDQNVIIIRAAKTHAVVASHNDLTIELED